jgi:hypothetical protein
MVASIGAGARGKGGSGEREVKIILRSILAPVYSHHNMELPDIERNLEQSRGGGYDLKGIEWLAIEVKRQERSNLKLWWKQTLEQTGNGQVPFLIHRANHQPWRVRTLMPVGICGGRNVLPLVVDLEREQWSIWLQYEVHARLEALKAREEVARQDSV